MSTGTVGNPTGGWTQSGWNEPGTGFAAASSFTMPADGWVTTLHGYFDTIGGSGAQGWLCIWRTSDGSLLASTASFTVNNGTTGAGHQQQWDIGLTPTFIAGGTGLWIGFYCNQTLLYSSGTGGSSYQKSMGTGGPGSFAGATASPIGIIEAYADYATGNAQKMTGPGTWSIGPANVDRNGTQTKGLAAVMRNGQWTNATLG